MSDVCWEIRPRAVSIVPMTITLRVRGGQLLLKCNTAMQVDAQLPCTHLAHHALESMTFLFVIMTTFPIVMITVLLFLYCGQYLVEVQRVAAACDALHLLPGCSRHDLGPEVEQVGQQQKQEEGRAVTQHMVPQLQPVCFGQHLSHDCGHQAPCMRLNTSRTCIAQTACSGSTACR